MPVNQRLLRIEIARQAGRAIVPRARKFIRLDFETKKKQFLQDFDNHPVTQEIEGGPETFGSFGEGNLFSLLGFFDDQRPITSLRLFLRSNITLGKKTRAKAKQNSILLETSVSIPTVSETEDAMSFDSDSALPWNTRSFLNMIHRGIPGIGRYLFDISRGWSFPPSRSGTAIQIKKKLSTGGSRPIRYVNQLLGDFKRLIAPRG